ncbi:MAG: type II secretion system GspH family protein [Rickettsiales bacterium]|nr:type II secretion system GspH family protein [Rickettsiales bacterium]
MKKYGKKKSNTAFSLLELSIVILIIAVFISGIMYAAAGASNIAKAKVTTDRMKEIYRAIGGYLSTNGRMPCPAPITDIKGATTYGNSQTDGKGNASGNCYQANTTSRLSGVFVATNLLYGMVPVQDLRLSSDMAEDGFGSKFAYIVDQRFAGFKENGSTTYNFDYAPDTSVITIKEAIDGSTTQTISSDAAFAIISYGANKSGAYSANSATQNARSSDSYEQENDLNAGVFDSNLISVAKRDDIFDDIIFYKTKRDIMVDFSVYSLVTCKAGTDTSSVYVNATSNTLAIWPSANYGQVVNSTNKCDTSDTNYNKVAVYPTKRCGAFGVWDSGAVQSCQ